MTDSLEEQIARLEDELGLTDSETVKRAGRNVAHLMD